MNLEVPIHENTVIGALIKEQQPNALLAIVLKGFLEGVNAGTVVLRPNQIERVLTQFDLLKRQGVVDETFDKLLKGLRR